MILLIDNYDSFTYNLYQALILTGSEVEVVRNDKITIDDIKKIDGLTGIVLSPGPKHPRDAGICIEVLQKIAGYVPIFGVCLGHQSIGVAFGGIVDLASEVLHGKPSMIYHESSMLFQGMTNPFQAARYHSLIIKQDQFPECLQVDAVDKDKNIMAISHREYPIFGVQFHPESILTPDGQQIVNNFVKFCNEHQSNNK
ncbi:MAG: aminodeoxychorismate/anthranilate synthase component II [Neisseriaceae bacterium]|nr:MAG: aminodeoxychorismate/anthranilate synthase component II [Neisseriaceae bacterium]